MAQNTEEGEINIVPFLDIIMNVMMFVLATLAVTFTSTAEVSPPRASPGGKPLGLTIVVVNEGFAIKASGGNVAPGCEDTGPGLAVGRTKGAYDFGALQSCVTRLKASAAFADERSVTVSADPGVPYQTLIATLDAVRQTDDGKDLFPDVALAVAR